jgi:hypothetical protein
LDLDLDFDFDFDFDCDFDDDCDCDRYDAGGHRPPLWFGHFFIKLILNCAHFLDLGHLEYDNNACGHGTRGRVGWALPTMPHQIGKMSKRQVAIVHHQHNIEKEWAYRLGANN